jgi:hypothetical protein
MNRFAWRLGALALVPLAGAAAATDSPRKKTSASEQTVRLMKIQKFQLLVTKASRTTCDMETMTSSPVTVELLTISAKEKYCVAIAPEVSVKTNGGAGGGHGNPKRVVWHLATTSLDTRGLEFHPDSGIVITIDNERQITSKGGHGDGSPGGPNPPSKTVYHVKSARDKQNAEVGYLPVVIWGTGTAAELCAAVDPKIVNN